MNPYNYEAMAFIKDSLESTAIPDPEDRARIMGLDQILGFLMQYERVSEPTDIEMRLWNETKGGALPEISKFRLPVTFLLHSEDKQDIFRLLKREFTLDNYVLWTKISRTVKIQPDNVCVQAS